MDDHSRSSPATDFVVHVNCLSDAIQYGNTSSSFTNNMKPSILLPYHTPYEVALSNIYFKQDFYQILAGDEDSSVQVVFYIVKKELKPAPPPEDSEETLLNSGTIVSNVESEGTLPNSDIIVLSATDKLTVLDQKVVDTITPSINLTDDIKAVVDEYNKQTPIFEYDELNMKITPKLNEAYLIGLIQKHNLFPNWYSPDSGNHMLVALKFGRVVGNYFGFYPNKPLFIDYDKSLDIDLESRNSKVIKPFPGFGQETSIPITNIFVYTNIVKRSRTGSQSSNLLEVVPFNTFSKNNSITIYKELSQFDIHYIKIRLTDEYGKNIPFLDNTYVAVDLHFKPKI